MDDFLFMNDSNQGGTEGQGTEGQGTGSQGTGGQGNGGQGSHDSAIAVHNDEQNDRAIYECMREKLWNHRVGCAHSKPYNNRLDDKFLPQEHEYICEKVVEAVEDGRADSRNLRNVKGVYPDRRYEGKISIEFITKFFP